MRRGSYALPALLLLGLLLVGLPLIRSQHPAWDEDDDDDGDSTAAAQRGAEQDEYYGRDDGTEYADGLDDDDDGDGEYGDGVDDNTPDENDVITLNAKNFEAHINQSKFALVEFYAPWCEHCQNLMPEYVFVAHRVRTEVPGVIIAKVDATLEEKLAGRFNLTGYPTLKWFVNGEPTQDYDGKPNAEEIVDWIKRKARPPVQPLADAAALAAAEAESEVVAVGYFKALEGEEHAAFTKAAHKTDDATFYETTDAAVAKAAGLEAPGVAVITNFKGEDRIVTPVAGAVTTDSVLAAVANEKLPPTIEYTEDSRKKVFRSGFEHFLFLFGRAADLARDAAPFRAFRNAAGALKGKLAFVTVDPEASSAARNLADYYGLNAAPAPGKPVLIGLHASSNKKFVLDAADSLTNDTVVAFTKGVLAGEAPRHYKSAPLPEKPKDGNITIVVGKTFDAIVKDPTKDVLLDVFAPWCGHCSQMAPEWVKLANRFLKIPSVVIASFDASANEHPAITTDTFPTILLFPAGEDKTPIVFPSDTRTLKTFTDFLKENAKIPFMLPKKPKAKAGDAEEAEDAKDEL